jgi:hypothetical protein
MHPFTPRRRQSCPYRLLGRCGLLLAPLLLGLPASEALAQANPRSTFPGRRIGGGTRGECTARLLAHLVPPASVFAPGASRTLGLLEGPVATPRPVLLEFQPFSSVSGGVDRASLGRTSRDLPASPAGVTLISLASFSGSMLWESSYRCGYDGPPGEADPLAFVDAVAPPALSLLVSDVTPADRPVQEALARLKAACGRAVPRQEVALAFGLEDLISAEWPASLPVRCL